MLPDLLIGLHLASEAEFCVADVLTGRRGGGASLHIFISTHTRIHTHMHTERWNTLPPVTSH